MLSIVQKIIQYPFVIKIKYWTNQNPDPCPLKNKQFNRNERKSYIPSHNADSSVQM